MLEEASDLIVGVSDRDISYHDERMHVLEEGLRAGAISAIHLQAVFPNRALRS